LSTKKSLCTYDCLMHKKGVFSAICDANNHAQLRWVQQTIGKHFTVII